ncbi:MAG: sulfatase-like hydrolase/transferase [Desulfobulbaceae bacterium]|nr:sulfatase-like hydrolase/transferase [Desulfobulbaceae bacterium]
MLKYIITNLSRLLVRFGLILALFLTCRVIFFLFNREFFEWLSPWELIKVLFLGLRFDIAGAVVVNALFIILATLPHPFLNRKYYGYLLFILFVITNSLALMMNLVDVAYYPFINKRSTSDIFSVVASSPDVISFIPRYILDFWHVALLYLILVYCLVIGYRKIPPISLPQKITWQFYPLQTFVFILIVGASVIGVRGGFQYGSPISLITAAQMVGARNSALALNTPFSIYRTIGKDNVTQMTYYSKKELADIYTPKRNFYNPEKPFSGKNVVLIIMESLSKEYMEPPYGKRADLAPFFNDFVKKGMFYKNTFANAKKSQDAIPAIIANIPPLMHTTYIKSIYSTNTIESLASVLNKKGYHTSFFHGGQNGTMDFNSFCRTAGYKEYIGMDEYPNREDYDGTWGIYDEPFFQFFAGRVDEMKEPFFATFYSVTSHEPFAIPEKYHERFPESIHPMHRTIQYADLALQRFFETSAKMDWYQNTLFVIVADHTMYGALPYYRSDLGKYDIPLLFYSPSDKTLVGASEQITQQLDIMPSILDYLHYDEPFFSLGKSVFDTRTDHFSISYPSGIYQYIKDGYVLKFDGITSLGLYDLDKDPMGNNNLIKNINTKIVANELEKSCQAVIQTFQESLIGNRMNSESWKEVQQDSINEVALQRKNIPEQVNNNL